MKILRSRNAIILTLFQLSCSSTEQFTLTKDRLIRPVPTPIRTLSYVDVKEKRIISRQADDNDQKPSACFLSSIPGAFFGEPTGEMFNRYQIRNGAIDLEISPARFHESLLISTMKRNFGTTKQSLQIVPASLKFSRVATLCRQYPTGFSTTGLNMLSLLFFDQPASIKGQIINPEFTIEVDLEIPEAGFYFIERVLVNPNNQQYRLFSEQQQIQYVVFPKSALTR